MRIAWAVASHDINNLERIVVIVLIAILEGYWVLLLFVAPRTSPVTYVCLCIDLYALLENKPLEGRDLVSFAFVCA